MPSSLVIATILGLVISNGLAVYAVWRRQREKHDEEVTDTAMVPAKYFKTIVDGQNNYIGALEKRVDEHFELWQGCERDKRAFQSQIAELTAEKRALASRVSELEARIGRSAE